MLRSIKQKPNENVHAYVERLLALAEDAYVGYNNGQQQAAGLAIIERQLIDYFIDGLHEEHLKFKVMRDSPATLQAAVTSATNEQTLRLRYNLRFSNNKKEEPMEVDHFRPQRRCQYCHRSGHDIKECRTRQRQINSVSQEIRQVDNKQLHPNDNYQNQSKYNSQSLQSNQRARHNFRNIECWNCGKLGHIRRNCRFMHVLNKPLN